MSRSHRDQKNWKLVKIHRAANVAFDAHKSTGNGISAYNSKTDELIAKEPSLSYHDLSHMPDKNHNERKSKARLKVAVRRSEKRSEKQRLNHDILEEFVEE